MKAVMYQTFGEPDQVVFLGDREKPSPKVGEVLVRMRLSSIHNHDLWTIRGNYGYKPELPAVGGSEAVGVIEAVGEGVQHLKVGQRVCSASIKGAWAEYFTVSANQVVPVPDGLDDETASQLISMPFSCLTLLDFIGAKKGEWIVLNAANGMVGKTTALLAKRRGIHVLNLVRRQEAVAELHSLGIEYALATDKENWQAQVQDFVKDAPIVAAVDSIGGSASLELSQLLSDGGVLISFGTMGGQAMQIPSGDLIFKQIVVKGFWASLLNQQMSTQDKQKLMQELMQSVLQGEVPLTVDGIFDLQEAKEACLASLRQGKKGKVLLRG